MTKLQCTMGVPGRKKRSENKHLTESNAIITKNEEKNECSVFVDTLK